MRHLQDSESLLQALWMSRPHRVPRAVAADHRARPGEHALRVLGPKLSHLAPLRNPGAVLDGRDIGTVICPDAEVKLFVTATPEERARRRFLELKRAGMAVSEEDVLADIRRRDERDKGRATAPLARAEDAVLLDTTNLDIDAAFRAAIDLIDAAMGHAGQAG